MEEVAVDRKTNMVAIKGKEADPLKLCDRVCHKTGRKAQLVSPLPKPLQQQPKDDQHNNKGDEPKKDQVCISFFLFFLYAFFIYQSMLPMHAFIGLTFIFKRFIFYNKDVISQSLNWKYKS